MSDTRKVPDLSDEEKINELIERSKNDRAIIVGSEVRWLGMIALRFQQAERELDRINRVAATGTAKNWLSLPDADKLKWFAQTLHIDKLRANELQEAERKLEAARPSEDSIKGANNIIEALGDSGRDRAHDEFADDVASELLRIHEVTRT